MTLVSSRQSRRLDERGCRPLKGVSREDTPPGLRVPACALPGCVVRCPGRRTDRSALARSCHGAVLQDRPVANSLADRGWPLPVPDRVRESYGGVALRRATPVHACRSAEQGLAGGTTDAAKR